MEKKKILLIEDETELVEIYEEVFKKFGFEIETLKWGSAALERLKEIGEEKTKKPDLILLDLILPDINGIKILEKARAEEGTKDIPFFILTNYSDPELEKIGKELKVEKYVIKTEVTPIQLAQIIKKWFKNKNLSFHSKTLVSHSVKI